MNKKINYSKMNKIDTYFKQTLEELLATPFNTLDGEVRPKYADGVPANTQFITHKVYEYDISNGEFPISNHRQLAWKSAIKEIFVFYQDQSNKIEDFEKRGIFWWKEWDIGDGTIGQRYSATVKKYDLINKLIHDLKTNKYSRRMIMNLFQYDDFKTPGLYPCAYETLWNVRGEYLDVILTQRSQDFLVAWNIDQIQYVALQMMIAHTVGLKPGKFMHVIANVHLYDRHIEQANDLINRDVSYKQAKLIFNPNHKNFYEYKIEDFTIEDYEPSLPQLKFELAI